MKVEEYAKLCGWSLLTGEEGIQREVKGCYIGDLLSWVMARAREGNIWLTVMGNVNAIAVASLTDVSCVVLTENAPLDEDAKARAEAQGIPIYLCEENAYQTALKVSRLMES